MTLLPRHFTWILSSWMAFVIILVGFLGHPTVALAIVPVKYATQSATVTATVPEELYSAPTLISPNNGSVTNNPFEIFSWNEATSTAGIHHYFFYFDGQILFDQIPNNVASYATAGYTLTHAGSIFSLRFKVSPADGYHTWQVDAYTNGTKTLPSETRKYLLDTTSPIIILTKVDKNDLYWASNDPLSIPQLDDRKFIIRQNNVLLKGKYEANSNLKLTLVCPVINCPNQSITINNDSGSWEHIFRGLIIHTTYTVYITAVDAAGNLTTFPSFTVTYEPYPLINFLITVIQHFRPQPQPEPVLPPTEVQAPPLPPLSPTPPPQLPSPQPQAQPTNLAWIIVWGLLLHLAMAVWGTGAPLLYIWKFIWRMYWPWSKGQAQATGWAFMRLYDPDHLQWPLRIDFTAITGRFGYPHTLPLQVFIWFTRPGYIDLKTLASASHLPSRLTLPLDQQPTWVTQLRLAFLYLRFLPLLAAIITSTIALSSTQAWYYGVYLYLSLHFGLSEYVYPHMYQNTSFSLTDSRS